MKCKNVVFIWSGQHLSLLSSEHHLAQHIVLEASRSSVVGKYLCEGYIEKPKQNQRGRITEPKAVFSVFPEIADIFYIPVLFSSLFHNN